MPWAAGTVHVRRRGRDGASVQVVAMQLLAGGAISLVISVALGENRAVTAAAWSPATLGSLAYLILGGSLLGFLAYSWLLARVPAAKVASHAYVNPLVAMLVGFSLGGEAVGGRMLLASAATIAGVALVLIPRREPSASPIGSCEPALEER